MNVRFQSEPAVPHANSISWAQVGIARAEMLHLAIMATCRTMGEGQGSPMSNCFNLIGSSSAAFTKFENPKISR